MSNSSEKDLRPPDLVVRDDLVVSESRIVAIEEDVTTGGDIVIDAYGLVVSPGFLDVHTHADLLAFPPEGSVALRSATLAQGVTTVIVGSCGFSVFPTFEEALDRVVERHLGSLFGPDARVVFDEKRVEDRATYSEPLLAPIGVEHVVVNGQHVVDRAQYTGRRAGHVVS